MKEELIRQFSRQVGWITAENVCYLEELCTSKTIAKITLMDVIPAS